MTRRMLDSRRFTNESYASMPIAARHLQDGCVNIADDQGRLKANPAYLRNEIFPYDEVQIEQIQVWLNLMVVNGTILLYQVNGRDYMQFLNWWVYQSLTFARPSDYPAPEGWEDRICMNGKSNILLTHNWFKADGTRIKDTCDTSGKPLPFVVERIAAGNGKRDKAKNNQTPGTPEKTDKVYTQAYTSEYTQAYTSEYTQEYTQVNKQETEVETEVETETKNNNSAGATSGAQQPPENDPETDVVVVLQAFGMSEVVAKRLRHRYAVEHIEEKIGYLRYELAHRPAVVKTTAGWLVCAIEQNYAPPDGFRHGWSFAEEEAVRRAAYTSHNHLLPKMPSEAGS